MISRTILSIVAVVLATGVAVSAQTVNRIVLRVNDQIATLHDYEKLRTNRVAAVMRSRMPPERRQEMLATIETDTMKTLFEELLVMSRAEQLGIRPAPEEVQAAVERTKQQMGIETTEQFQQALSESGMTVDELVENTRKNLILQRVIGRDVTSQVELTEEDLRRYYSTNQELFRRPQRLSLREIVVLEESGAPAVERQRLAEELAGKLAAGLLEDAEVEKLSEEGLVTGWVEIGWVESGDLDPQIEAAVWGLSAGQSSEPVDARGGLHLVQVLDREESGLMEFKEVEDQIRAREQQRAFQEEMARYLRELEDASYIVSDPPPGAAGFRATLYGDTVSDDPLLDFERQVPAAAAPPAPEASGEGALDGAPEGAAAGDG